MSHPFDDCRHKIERAKEQIADLVATADAFRKAEPYRIVSEFDEQKGEHVFRIHIITPIPTRYNLLVGECLQSLRSALDYAICSLSITVDEKTGFPIHRLGEPEYKASRMAKVKGLESRIATSVIDYIDSLKPYNGGNVTLWRLNQLNNREKHRLVLTAGLGLRHIVGDAQQFIPPFFLIQLYARMRREQGLPFRVQDIPTYPPIKMKSVVGEAVRVFPLEDGVEFFRIRDPTITAFPKSGNYFEFAFDIAFNEPQIIQGEPVPEFLHQTLGLVTSITDTLATFI